MGSRPKESSVVSVEEAIQEAWDRCGLKGSVVFEDEVDGSVKTVTSIDEFIDTAAEIIEERGHTAHIHWEP